jgi:DNA-binding NarL/FixJ family response regulator
MPFGFHPQGKVRVILIEDSESIRMRLAEALSEIEHIEVIGYAETEAEAISLLRHIGWDVAVLDLQLKAGTGIGVLKSVTPDERPPKSSIIVFTNYAFPQYKDRCLQLGAQGFFDKSRELHKLRDCVRAVVARHGAIAPARAH